MKKILLLILLFSFSNAYTQNGSPTCDGAEPACSDNTGVKIFPNVTGVANQGAIGCLLSTPNPTWFYIKVGDPGDLNFKIIQNTSFDTNGNPSGVGIDVDFIAWGPFNSPDSNCSALDNTCATGYCPNNNSNFLGNNPDGKYYIDNRDGSNIIDCSWSGRPEETFTIPDAQAGKFYMLLITNYSAGISGFIKLEQTNLGVAGAGTSDCSIVPGELGTDQEICVGTNVPLDATPTTGIIDTYEWQVDTGSGFNTITGETNAILNITNNLSGIYKALVIDIYGKTGEDEVTITFFEVPIANTVMNFDICDTDRDGFNAFNFDLEASPQVIGTQSTTDFEVLYFTSMAAADANVAGTNITSPYTNTTAFTQETIYARIHNVGRTECYNIIHTSIE